MSHVRVWLAGALISGALLLPGVASAQLCWFTAGQTGLTSFSYSPLSAGATTSFSTFNFDCEKKGGGPSVRARVTLSAGSAGSFYPRTMLSSGSVLEYSLCGVTPCDPTTQPWGDDTDASTYKATSVAPGAILTVYGSIPAGQWVAEGVYTDRIWITADY